MILLKILSSDFLDLRNLCSLIDLSSICNITGLTSPISSKNPDSPNIPGTKMTNICPVLWNGSPKIQFFTDIL